MLLLYNTKVKHQVAKAVTETWLYEPNNMKIQEQGHLSSEREREKHTYTDTVHIIS